VEKDLPAPAKAPADYLQSRLSEYVGQHTTRIALRTFAHKALGCAPEQVRPEQAPTLVMALRPLLRSMLGNAAAEQLVTALLEEMS
jgi:hypothetical protein